MKNISNNSTFQLMEEHNALPLPSLMVLSSNWGRDNILTCRLRYIVLFPSHLNDMLKSAHLSNTPQGGFCVGV